MQPRKRKESNAKMADASFRKHVYGREHKHAMQPIEDFDPKPPESRELRKRDLHSFWSQCKVKGSECLHY